MLLSDSWIKSHRQDSDKLPYYSINMKHKHSIYVLMLESKF